MKKVVIIHNRLVIGGPAIAIAETIKQLHTKFQFFLIVGRPLKDEQDAGFLFENIPNLTIIPIDSMHRLPSIWNDINAYRILYKTIRKIKPMVIHTHGSKPGLLGRIAASRLKVPIIIHTYHGHIFHSYFNRFLSRLVIRLEKYLAGKTTYILAISHFLQYEIVETYRIAPKEKVRMIPLGLDLTAYTEHKQVKRNIFREKYGVTGDEIAIGIVGRITPIKNMRMFIDAIQQLQQSEYYGKLKFFIVGDGDEKEKLKRSLQLYQIPFAENPTENGQKVVFTSWLLEMDLVMNGLDILCLTSLNEGTPVSIIEAMAAKKPVLATNAGSVGEIVINDKTGYVTPVADVDAFVKALKKMVSQPEKMKQFGETGYAMVQEQFNPKNAAEALFLLYNKE